MADQFKLLKPFEWRGIQYPVGSRNVSFAHETVQHKLQRRNNDLVEQIGAHNLVFTYTFPMRESLFVGPYRRLFTEGLPRLFADCRNKEEGELVDPIYGFRLCVPASYNDESDVLKRDGTDIRVEFHESPEDEDDEQAPPFASEVQSDAATTAVLVQEVLIEEDETEEFPPNVEIDLIELMREYATFGRNVLNTPNDAVSYMNKIAFWGKEIVDITNEANDPRSFQIRQQAQKMRDRALSFVSNNAQIQPVRVRTFENPMSVSSIASLLGVSVPALIKSNPSIMKYPTVPVGFPVVVPNA